MTHLELFQLAISLRKTDERRSSALLVEAEEAARGENDLWSAASYCKIRASFLTGRHDHRAERLELVERAVNCIPEEASIYEWAGMMCLISEPKRASAYYTKAAALGSTQGESLAPLLVRLCDELGEDPFQH